MINASESLGIGIIGYGGFGQFLHRSWLGLDSIEVRAVADANPALRADAYAVGTGSAGIRGTRPEDKSSEHRATASGVTFYEDWRALLTDEAIHIVSIATPPFTHADMACEAMRAGRHVLIEKPLATTRDDALRIRTVAAETGRIAAVDYMLRFNPIVEALQTWAHDESFGKLRRIIVENYAQDASLAADHWFWDSVKSGGILVEHAVHFIDVVLGCTVSEPVSVEGLAVQRDDGRTDRMGLTVVFSNGLVTQQFHAFSRPGFFEETGMRFVFDLAQVEVEGWIPLGGRLVALTNGRTSGDLERMPGFHIRERTRLGDIDDTSRPAGWGHGGSDDSSAAAIRSGGRSYDVTEQIRGTFTLPIPKAAAYAEALRLMIADVAAAIRDPDHRLRAGLDEGMHSLDIAITASQRAIRVDERSDRRNA